MSARLFDRMRPRAPSVAILIAIAGASLGCGSAAPPTLGPTAATVAIEPEAPPAVSSPGDEGRARPAARPGSAAPVSGPAGLRATTAMRLEGTVDPSKLVVEINRQIGPLGRCAALIRATDSVVGSLNLELAIVKDGRVTTKLQSPVNDEAQRCLLEGARAWKVTSAGEGSAMLLLQLEP